MNAEQIEARFDRAIRAYQMGFYRIEAEAENSLYDFSIGYTARNGQPVVYHVNAFGCTCPDFLRNGTYCKHQALCQIHRETVRRFEQEIDALLDSLHTAPPTEPHTVYHPIPGYWGLRLASKLSPEEIADRIGPALAAKCQLEPNQQKGYFEDIDPCYPVRLQVREIDLDEIEKAAILFSLDVPEVV